MFGGIYLAINPRLYHDGLVKWVPPAIQPNVNATLEDAGEALKRWHKVQVLAMLLVGVFAGLELFWLVGVPSAFASGFQAGVCQVRADHRPDPYRDTGAAHRQQGGLADSPIGFWLRSLSCNRPRATSSHL